MFKNSKRFNIKGSTVNSVGRDQINSNTTFNVNTLHYNGEIATKRTEYDEFEYVKRGDVITIKEICSMNIAEYKRKGNRLRKRDKGERRVYSVELVDRRSKFTAVEYRGKEADEVWEEDFQQFSRDRDPNSWLLYGINHSEVPMLIFHHDLIPLTHFHTESLWMNLYLRWLMEQMGCSDEQIWMDTSKGIFCVGPSGPHSGRTSWILLPDNTIIIPSTTDMLDTDTISRFFQQFNSKELHQALMSTASSFRKFHRCDSFLRPALSPEASEEEQLHLQSFFPGLPYEQLCSSLLGLRFDIVYSTSLDAVARWPQEAITRSWALLWDGLVDQTSVGELTRFTMCGDKIRVYVDFDIFSRRRCWLSQFPRCMQEGRSEDYFFIDPELELISEHSRKYDGLACSLKLCDGENPPPIYLFLYPLPMTMSGIISWAEGRAHFWSLDENGQSEMTEDELEQWDVPRLAPRTNVWLISWPSDIYTALYDWQVACRFDPNTADFARLLDIPELEILRPKEEKPSSWWEAVPGSGISAFGF